MSFQRKKRIFAEGGMPTAEAQTLQAQSQPVQSAPDDVDQQIMDGLTAFVQSGNDPSIAVQLCEMLAQAWGISAPQDPYAAEQAQDESISGQDLGVVPTAAGGMKLYRRGGKVPAGVSKRKFKAMQDRAGSGESTGNPEVDSRVMIKRKFARGGKTGPGTGVPVTAGLSVTGVTDPAKAPKPMQGTQPQYLQVNPQNTPDQVRLKAQNNLNEALRFKNGLRGQVIPQAPVIRDNAQFSVNRGNPNSLFTADPTMVQKADSTIAASRRVLYPTKIR